MEAFSKILRKKLEIITPSLFQQATYIFDPKEFSSIYPSYLRQMHCIIRASVPLMQNALSVCSTSESSLNTKLGEYFSIHIKEELNHDKWILDDLKLLGENTEFFLNEMPSSEIAQLVGSQYYLIHHCHPAVLLGYIAVLEGYPPNAYLLQQLIARSGLPAQSFNTLLKHAAIDPGHKEDLDTFLDEAPIPKRLQEFITLNAINTVRQLIAVFAQLTTKNNWDKNANTN